MSQSPAYCLYSHQPSMHTDTVRSHLVAQDALLRDPLAHHPSRPALFNCRLHLGRELRVRTREKVRHRRGERVQRLKERDNVAVLLWKEVLTFT